MSRIKHGEETVYLCCRKRSTAGFQLWVRSTPALRGDGATYAEAEEHLLEAIRTAGGAMVPILEFDRPLPPSTLDAKYSHPHLVLIGGDDPFRSDAPLATAFESPDEREVRLQWLDRFFQAPVCRTCGNATAARSDRPLSLLEAPRGDGGFGHVGHGGAPVVQVFAEEFLELLSPPEREALALRPVMRTGRGRKRFYELFGPAGPPPVAVTGLPVKGWRCPDCAYRVWGYWIEGMRINSFISSGDLPEAPLGVFTIGPLPGVQLVATAERWQELVGRKGTRGFVSRPLGVAAAAQVERDPELPVHRP